MKISHIPKNQNATSSRLGLLEFGALESATFFIVCARFEVDYKQVGSAGFTVSEGGQYIIVRYVGGALRPAGLHSAVYVLHDLASEMFCYLFSQEGNILQL